MSVSKPTITYFNLPGLGEVPRLLLEDAGVDYDWVVPPNWAELKPQYQASGKAPFGQLPLYDEPSGLSIVQSSAIVRHLARTHGYYGADTTEAALVDQAYEGVIDLRTAIVTAVFRTPEDQKPQAKDKLLKETLPSTLEIYVRLLEKNGSNGFLVGSKLSFADLCLYSSLGMLTARVEGAGDVINGFPAIKAFSESVSSRDRIKAYLARDVYAAKSS